MMTCIMIDQSPALLSLFSELPEPAAEEDVEILLERPGLRLERVVSYGHASQPGFWYDQTEAEWVLLVQGGARLRLEGEAEDRFLGPGDHMFLAPHLRHRVTWTAPDMATIWLVLFLSE